MKLATSLKYAGGFKEPARQLAALEKAGLDVVWVQESYSFDAVSAMGYIAALTERIKIGSGILPIYSRTPTLLAMTAAGLDALSDRRFILGLGASGPQIVEGWHGVAFDKPLSRLREVVTICRRVWARDGVVTNEGPLYPLPLPNSSGRPLKMINHPLRSDIPIFIASLSERSVALTAEIADGWIPQLLLPERIEDVFGRALKQGFAKRDADRRPLEICAGGFAFIGGLEEAQKILDLFVRPLMALNIGGMGTRGKNFPNELVRRYGFETEAAQIQELFLEGKRDEAAAAVPDELLRLTNLCGPVGFVKERIEAFREAGVTILDVTLAGPEPVELLQELKTMVA